jgi:hypothetical protein
MKITRVSLLSRKTHTLDIDVTEDQIERWRAGANIQDAMPHLSAADREFVMSGITDEEWKAHFRAESEEEPEERDGTELQVHDSPGYGVHNGE